MVFTRPRIWEPELAGVITRPGRILEYVSFFYLFIPFPLFFFGFLKLPYALASTAILGAALAVCLRSRFRGLRAVRVQWSKGDFHRLLAIVAITLAWCFLTGTGGFKGQAGDYIKNNSILFALIEKPWPPDIADLKAADKWTWLVYFPAHFLPAAFVGKLLGWNVAYAFWSLWTALGVFLSVAWLLRIQRGLSLLTVLLFMMFGGLDLIAYALVQPDGRPVSINCYMDWWATFLCYLANSTSLDNAPNHALPAWILMGMVLHDVFRRNRLDDLGLYLLASFAWSPFVTLGLLPFIALACFERRFRGAFTFQNFIATPLLALPFALYYQSRRYSQPVGFCWSQPDFGGNWHFYPLLWIVEFGIYAAVCYHSSLFADTPGRRRWWWTALGSLIAVSLFRYGINNDLAMRGSVPALFFLITVFDTRLLVPAITRDIRAMVLLALLVIGIAPGFVSLYRGLDEVRLSFPDPERCTYRFETEERILYANYQGDPEKLFFRYLSRRQPGTYVVADTPLPCELVITPLGEKNPESKGTAVWVWRLYKTNGAAVPWGDFSRGGDWTEKMSGEWMRMNSAGKKGAALRWQGESDQDMCVLFLSHAWSGKAVVRWQGAERTVDLYSPRRNEMYRLRLPVEGW